MTAVDLPNPRLLPRKEITYGHARMPRNISQSQPAHVDKVQYGRFRNVYLYITEACQLRCGHCYMGSRLERAVKMPMPQIHETLDTWRRLGGSKLTILGGEPTIHPDYCDVIRLASKLGYEHVITTTNGQEMAAKKFALLDPSDFAYVQISFDGGSPETNDVVRGPGTFERALRTAENLTSRGFDVRFICTVNKANESDALRLLQIADDIGASLVKYHVFSTIGRGHGNSEWAMNPHEWITFYENLEQVASEYNTRVWYQPTYAREERMPQYQAEGYAGCVGRTLDRISIFPDGRCYVCSYLFDTDMHYAEMVAGKVQVNKGANEFDLFTQGISEHACGDCKATSSCGGGCPAEKVVMGDSSCAAHDDIVPVCRLWKSDIQ